MSHSHRSAVPPPPRRPRRGPEPGRTCRRRGVGKSCRCSARSSPRTSRPRCGRRPAVSAPESTPAPPAPPTPPSPTSPLIVPAHLLASRAAKVRDHHLDRKAIVYVRQSSPQQVAEHKESTARQYALVERALALGWPPGQVEVIDEDQGR